VYTDRYTQRHHIDRLNTESHQQCVQVKTYIHKTTNNNYSTVSNSIYSGGGPVGRPLYLQLSGHCNRPFPRDSRVFTRRLTTNLVCSRSHTESTTELHREQSRRLPVNTRRTTIQGHTVHMVTRQLTIQGYTWYTPTR